jgi:hypothetical protein
VEIHGLKAHHVRQRLSRSMQGKILTLSVRKLGALYSATLLSCVGACSLMVFPSVNGGPLAKLVLICWHAVPACKQPSTRAAAAAPALRLLLLFLLLLFAVWCCCLPSTHASKRTAPTWNFHPCVAPFTPWWRTSSCWRKSRACGDNRRRTYVKPAHAADGQQGGPLSRLCAPLLVSV